MNPADCDHFWVCYFTYTACAWCHKPRTVEDYDDDVPDFLHSVGVKP